MRASASEPEREPSTAGNLAPGHAIACDGRGKTRAWCWVSWVQQYYEVFGIAPRRFVGGDADGMIEIVHLKQYRWDGIAYPVNCHMSYHTEHNNRTPGDTFHARVHERHRPANHVEAFDEELAALAMDILRKPKGNPMFEDMTGHPSVRCVWTRLFICPLLLLRSMKITSEETPRWVPRGPPRWWRRRPEWCQRNTETCYQLLWDGVLVTRG